MRHPLAWPMAILAAAANSGCTTDCAGIGCGDDMYLTVEVPLIDIDAMRAASFTVCRGGECYSGDFAGPPPTYSVGVNMQSAAAGIVSVDTSRNDGGTWRVDIWWLNVARANEDIFRFEIKDYAGKVVLDERDTVNYEDFDNCDQVCRRGVVVNRSSNILAPTVPQPVDASIDPFVACNAAAPLTAPTATDGGPTCPIVGTWDVVSYPAYNPPIQTSFIFDGNGNWVGGTYQGDVCATRSMGGTYRFSGDVLRILTGYSPLTGYDVAASCQTDAGAGYAVTFESACTQARLLGIDAACAVTQLNLMTGSVLTRRAGPPTPGKEGDDCTTLPCASPLACCPAKNTCTQNSAAICQSDAIISCMKSSDCPNGQFCCVTESLTVVSSGSACADTCGPPSAGIACNGSPIGGGIADCPPPASQWISCSRVSNTPAGLGLCAPAPDAGP
jgi:hypothetical protein